MLGTHLPAQSGDRRGIFRKAFMGIGLLSCKNRSVEPTVDNFTQIQLLQFQMLAVKAAGDEERHF